MKKRILSILLAVMMIVPMFAMPISATDEAKPIYSWTGFATNDIRNAYDGQVVDLGFKGPVANEPVVDGSVGNNEYTATNTIPLMTDANYSIEAHYAVYGNYLYIAVDQSNAKLGDASVADRQSVQVDIGVAANYSAEATWNRQAISINAAGEMSATRTPFNHELGANVYQAGMSPVRNADYLVDYAFANGVYEFKVDLGQLYRLFSNLPGGQDAWEAPCVNFSFWILGSSSDHYCLKVSPNFQNANGRSGDWVSCTVLIPQATLASLKNQYKGVIGPLGYDQRNAIEGQLISINGYATVAPTVDGKLTAEDGYTTTGAWTGHSYQNEIGDIKANLSVKDGYLYGAIQANNNLYASGAGYLTAFGAVNSAFMRDSRCQTSIKAGGAWGGDQGGMWKVAQGPSKAAAGNWDNVELNSKVSAANAWKKVVTSYDEATNTTTVEFQLSIPALLAVLQFEGYNPEEAAAVQFGFWPNAMNKTGDAARFTLPTAVETQIAQTNGYQHTSGTILPMIGLPKGCAELYHVEDVDDMEAFGQRVANAKPSTATVDGIIGSGEYTATNYWSSTDFVSYNDNSKKIDSTMTQTDYYAYDADYFYYGAKIYDPYYVEGSSLLQMNINVLNKHDSFTVKNFYYTVKDKSAKQDVNTLRENYIDIGDVITRASWDNTLNNDGVATNMNSKPGCVIRSQTLTSAALAADAQAAFKERANTFADAGYQFAGHYDEATQTYVYEAKIPLAELKNLFQLGDDYDINSINVYTLYKYDNPDVVYFEGTEQEVSYDYAVSYKVRDAKLDCAWEALRTLTQACKGSTGTPYNQNCIPNVVKFVDAPITKDSGSVRLSTQNAGLRFKSVYTNDYLAYMAAYAEAKGETMEIGTLIAPEDFINDGKFTHADLGEGKYIEVMASVDTPYANANGVTTIAGSIVNIKAANLTRDFAGRGFIRIGDEIFYADTYTVRNVAEIATAALADTSANYTDGQKLILGKLNGTVTE